MLKTLRELKFGWYLIVFSIVSLASGLAMIVRRENGNTFLCFDAGCKWVQGMTLLALAAFTIVVGVVNIKRK